MIATIAPICMTLISSPVNTKTQNPGFKYYGDIQPTGFFDPLNLEKNNDIKYLREAELQHGRIAMLASIAIPTFELMNPDKLGIDMLSSQSYEMQIPFWYAAAVLEFYRMYTGWNNPFVGKDRSIFKLKDDYQPGNLYRLNLDNITERRYNSELSNGRLAMLASAYIIGSELLTHKGLFE